MWHVWETGEVYIGFWWGELRERDNLQELGVDGTIIIKWTGMIGLRTGSRGRLL
jgi:hypothetical protein